MSKLYIFFSILFWFSVSCAAQPIAVLPTPVATVPFRLIDNRPMVRVAINGVEGYFGLDTGGVLGLNEEFADSAGLTKGRSFSIKGAGDAPQTAWYGSEVTPNLVQASVSLQTARPLIVNLSPIRDSLQLPHLDGIIGAELFRHFVAGIDYPNRQLTLYVARDFPLNPEGYTSLPFRFHRNQIPQIEARVNGISGDFIIDTGDRSRLTLFQEFSEKAGFSHRPDLRPLHTTGYGLGGPIPAREFRLESLALGDSLVYREIKTRIPEMKGGVFASAQHAGSIGSGLLKEQEVIFDYHKQRMHLRGSPSVKIKEFVYHAANMEVLAGWYEKQLGFSRLTESEQEVVLGRGNARIRLLAAAALPTKAMYKAQHKREPNGVFKFGFTVPDLHAFYRGLADAGIGEGKLRLITFYSEHFFLLRDPEGNMLQFFEDVTGNERWENRFYALITNNEKEYDGWLQQLETRGMQELYNFNKPEEGIRQQSFARGKVVIELLQLPDRSHVATPMAASGIPLSTAWESLEIKQAAPENQP